MIKLLLIQMQRCWVDQAVTFVVLVTNEKFQKANNEWFAIDTPKCLIMRFIIEVSFFSR